MTPCLQDGVRDLILRLTRHLGWDSARATPIQGVGPRPTILGSVGDKAVNAEARTTLCDGEEPVCERMQDRHRERDTHTQRIRYIPIGNDYKSQQQQQQQPLKGYKVTL